MAGRIPQNFIDDLISRLDIIDVVSARTRLKKAGKNYSACCPFHNEKTPSFTVSRRLGSSRQRVLSSRPTVHCATVRRFLRSQSQPWPQFSIKLRNPDTECSSPTLHPTTMPSRPRESVRASCDTGGRCQAQQECGASTWTVVCPEGVHLHAKECQA